jgi:hypothetical protein
VLSIWRERSSESGIYDRIGGIELGVCGSEDPAPSVPGMSGVYECTLPQNERVSVQPGDVVGIELPASFQADFQLYFDNTNNRPTNYVFDSPGSTFSLSQASSSPQDQPQVSLTVEPAIVPTTPALPTTQPQLPATTEASSTMADPPTPPSLTSTSMATIDPPTSTEASTTMAAATDPHATTTGSPTTDTAGSTTPSTTDAQTPREGEAVQQRESNTGTIAGAAVGAIIAILLVLIIVLLLVLILRRQTRNGKQFTPSSISNIVNSAYISGKPSYSQFRDCFLFLVFLL